MSWFKQQISRIADINSPSTDNEKHHSKADISDLVSKFQKMVSNLKKDEPPENCIKFYVENFCKFKQKQLKELPIQSEISRLIRHLILFIEDYIENNELGILTYNFLNLAMYTYAPSSRTDSACFKLFIQASQTEDTQIIEAALPFINSCLQIKQLISLFFSGDELVSIWTNIYVGSQSSSDYIGSMINMSLTNMASIPHINSHLINNLSKSSNSSKSLSGNYIFSGSSTLNVSSRLSPTLSANSSVSDDLTFISPFIEKVNQDINNNTILSSLAPRAFMFLGLIIRKINTGDFLPSICENIRQMANELDNLDFLEPFIQAKTSDPGAVWSLIDSICADKSLRIELLASVLNAIHNSGATPSIEVFSFNSFVLRYLELSEKHQNILIDIISSSEIPLKADFICESIPLSKTGITTKSLFKIIRNTQWGDTFCDSIIEHLFIKQEFDEVYSDLIKDKYFIAITECLISQISYKCQFTSFLFKILSKSIIDSSDLSLCHILTLLLCRTNPNHYMADIIELILTQKEKVGALLLSIFSFTAMAVRKFAKIFLKNKGLDTLNLLFSSKAGLNFIASLVVDGPYKKIDDFIFENFEKSSLKTLNNSQLIKLMMGVSQDSTIEQEQVNVEKDKVNSSTMKGLLRIPSLCAFVKDVPLLSPYDMYIYGAYATEYFTPADDQISKFSSVYIPKSLLNKVMKNWEMMINLTRPDVDYNDVLQFHQEPNIQMKYFSASKIHPNNYTFPYSTEQNCSIQVKHTPTLSFWFKILNIPNVPTIIASFNEFQLTFTQNSEISIDGHSTKCSIKKWHLASFVFNEKNSSFLVYFNGKHFCDLSTQNHQLDTFIFGYNPDIHSKIINNETKKEVKDGKQELGDPNSFDTPLSAKTIRSDWLLMPYLHLSQESLHHSDIKTLYESGPQTISQKRLKPANTVRLVHYRGALKQMHLFGGPIFIFQEMMKTTTCDQFQMQLIIAFNLYKLGFFSRTLFNSLLRYIIKKQSEFAKPIEMFIMNEFSCKDGFNWRDFISVMGDTLLLASPKYKGRVLTKTMLYMKPNFDDLKIFYTATEILSFFNIDDETFNNIITIISLYLEKNLAKKSLLSRRLLLNVIALPFFDSDDAFGLFYDSRVEIKQKQLLDILTKDKQNFMNTFTFKMAIIQLQMLHQTLAVEFLFYLSDLCLENKDYFDFESLKSASVYLCMLVDKEIFWVSILRMLFNFTGTQIKKFMKSSINPSSLKLDVVIFLLDLITTYIPYEYQKNSEKNKNHNDYLSLKLLQAIEMYINSINPSQNSIFLQLLRPVQKLCSLGFGQKEPFDYPFKIHQKSSSDNDLRLSSTDEDSSSYNFNNNTSNSNSYNFSSSASNSANNSYIKFDELNEISIDDVIGSNDSSSQSRKRSATSRSKYRPSSAKPLLKDHHLRSLGKRFSKPEIPLSFNDIGKPKQPLISGAKSDFMNEPNNFQLITQEYQKMEPSLFDEAARHFANHPVDTMSVYSIINSNLSKIYSSILYEREEDKLDPKSELISKDLNVDFFSNSDILNSKIAQVVANIAAKTLANLSNNSDEFRKALHNLTIFGSDVLPKVAAQMHKKVILTLIGENRISMDSLWILISFLVSRIIEGWWDSPNVLSRLFILVIRNATAYHSTLCPFIFICFYQVSQMNNVEYLKQMGYALFGSPILGSILEDGHFYKSIVHLLLTCQIQDSSDGNSFFIFMIEQITKHFESPHLQQLKEVITQSSSYDDISDQSSIHDWIEQNKNHYNDSYLAYHKDVLLQAAHDHVSVRNERSEISFRPFILVASEYLSLIIKEVTEMRRVFRYQFFARLNKSSVFLERAINALFKNKAILEHSSNTVTKKVAVVPGPHPLVVPTKLIPMLFEYEAPYKKTSQQVEVPQSETFYSELNTDLSELKKPNFGPKCLEKVGLPPYIKHASIFQIFKSRFNGVSEPFLCYLHISPEILRCVAVLSNNNIHILMNANLSNGVITLIDKVMLCHYPTIENAMYGMYGESSLFLSHVVLNISFSSITMILPRTYIYESIALDLFTSYGCHFSLSMNSPIRNQLLEKIQVKPVSNSKRGVLFSNRLLSKPFDDVLNLWKNNHLSNFDYLLYLNAASGRSFNDFSQYPVFPWIISSFSGDSPNGYRDLSKPMGQQTPKRTEHYLQIFKETNQSYFYGTHYSYPTSVMYFMMRIEPCTLYNVMLHSGFDHPDRLFYSISDSYRSASEVNQADVRELIPEMYAFPELLTNVNHIELQKRTTGASIDNVILPPWSKNDPFKFIWQMRTALECQETSKNLPAWIDLIFGYKQRGKAAIEAKNLFHPISYNTFVKEKDSEFYRAQKESIINFGQCPIQLLKDNPHPVKNIRAFKNLDNTETRECLIKHLPRYTYHIRVYDNELIASPFFSFFVGNPPFLVHVNDGYMQVKGEIAIIDQLFDRAAASASSENTILTIATGAGIILNYYFDPSAQYYLISSSILPEESFMTCDVSSHYGIYCASTKTHLFLFDLASGFLMKKIETNGAASLIQFDEVHDFIIAVSDLQITVYTTNLSEVAHKEFTPFDRDSSSMHEIAETLLENNEVEILIDESQDDKEEDNNERDEKDKEEEDDDDQTDNNIVIETIENTQNTETDTLTDTTGNTDNQENQDNQNQRLIDHNINHVNNCVTSLAVADSTLWYPTPFFVTGHNDGSVYLWQILPLENKLKPLRLLSHKLRHKITAIKIFRRNQALVCCDVKGNAETISTVVLLKNLLSNCCFDRCACCLEPFENDDKMSFCALCGLPNCKKCMCEGNPSLCKACQSKDANAYDSYSANNSIDQDL